MDVVVYIRGDAEGLNEMAGQLKTGGIKCSLARNFLEKAKPPATADVALGITGDSVAITVSVMTFLATRRDTWRLRIGGVTATQGYTCQQIESTLIGSHAVLEKLPHEESTV
jgi:hypothetical protein